MTCMTCFFGAFGVSEVKICNELCQARELGRYGAATQLAKRGGSTWTLKTCNDAMNRSKETKKENLSLFSKASWESLKCVSVLFEKCLSIAGNISLSFPRLFLFFGRFEESHQDGHWHLARICKNMFWCVCSVVLDSSLSLGEFLI